MAVIAPQTDVFLLKVPLEINDLNQLTFANATAQYNYFISLPKLEVTNFTYQRKDGTIRYGANFDDLIGYNYVMYRNTAYSNKWFYAFITSMEYLNDNVTAISIKTDVWQTWQFDITYKPVLVEREHTNDDTVGKNTLPEGLELGDFITNGGLVNFGGVGGTNNNDYCCVVEVSQIENDGESATLSYQWASGTHDSSPYIGSIYRGTIPLVLGVVSGGRSDPGLICQIYDEAGLGDSIVNIYMLPKSLVGSYYELSISVTRGGYTHTAVGLAIPQSTSGVTTIGTSTFTKPSTVGSYVPKNNKLLTYPYMYFNISNNAGTSLPYRYEDFSSTVSFLTEGVFGLSGSVKTTPQNYKGITTSENAMDYSITAAKYPVCSWKSDSYTNWLTQNSVNMAAQWQREILGAGVDIVGGAVRGGIAGSLAGGVGAIPGAIAGGATGLFSGTVSLLQLAKEQHLAKTQANMVSDQVKGNLGCGDYLWAKYRSPFTYIPMSIKAEYARCIDEYFSQFGYATNRVKTPNVTGRKNWNYVKTVGCYLNGDIPQEDMAEIKAMFDKGITFWHDPLYFGNYGADNSILTT